jgi:hypothetical protein
MRFSACRRNNPASPDNSVTAFSALNGNIRRVTDSESVFTVQGYFGQQGFLFKLQQQTNEIVPRETKQPLCHSFRSEGGLAYIA